MAKIVDPSAVCDLIAGWGAGEAAISRVAELQLALITSEQAVMSGLSTSAISRRVRGNRWQRLHHGVYHVGPPPLVPGARELAAILACGPPAYVSHRSAAALWQLPGDGAGEEGDAVDVTVAGRSGRSREGLRLHRAVQLAPPDRALRDGIPVTSPARTLLDQAATLTAEQLERAVAEAQVRRLVGERELLAAIARQPHARGAAALRACLAREGGPALTRSEAERRMLSLTRRAGLREPASNVRIAGCEVDFVWPAERLIVEIDGYRFHGHRTAFERDRRRDALMAAAGYRVIRITWRQLVHEPLLVIARLAGALARS